MNNKGFIATSLVYSFFLVFVAVMASILATYAHNRILVNNINEGIVEDLNESIENKYLVIENMLKNSDFEENSNWEVSNASITVVPNPIPSNFKLISYHGLKSMSIKTGTGEIRQRNLTLTTNHYYYLRYYAFRNGPITGSSNFILEKTGNAYNFNLNYVSGSLYANWDLMSNIILVTQGGSYVFKISNTNINGGFEDLNIDSIMLIDVTDLLKGGMSVPNIKNYIDTLDYFEGKKSIPKP